MPKRSPRRGEATRKVEAPYRLDELVWRDAGHGRGMKRSATPEPGEPTRKDIVLKYAVKRAWGADPDEKLLAEELAELRDFKELTQLRGVRDDKGKARRRRRRAKRDRPTAPAPRPRAPAPGVDAVVPSKSAAFASACKGPSPSVLKALRVIRERPNGITGEALAGKIGIGYEGFKSRVAPILKEMGVRNCRDCPREGCQGYYFPEERASGAGSAT